MSKPPHRSVLTTGPQTPGLEYMFVSDTTSVPSPIEHLRGPIRAGRFVQREQSRTGQA